MSNCLHRSSGPNSDGTEFCTICGLTVFTYHCPGCGPIMLEGNTVVTQLDAARAHIDAHSVTKRLTLELPRAD